MDSVHRLETPPPASRFRRPWSPEPFDPNPPQAPSGHPDYFPAAGHGFQTLRQPSEVSVEALDLADYARTLAQNTPRTREHISFQPYDPYPPFPRPAGPLLSHDSYALPPLTPSSSASHSHDNSGASAAQSHGRAHRAQHRPFSLPTPSLSHYPSIQSHPTYSSRSSAAHTYEPDEPLLTPPAEADGEIDIGQFPRFARHWYNNSGAKDGMQDLQQPLDVFDPARIPDAKIFPTAPGVYSPPYLSSQMSHSSRDIGTVPWGNAADGPSVDPEVKEERLRMLEREFGGKNVGKAGTEEEHMVGSVDSKGRLITEGPKKRAASRWIQALLSLLAAGSSIYAAAVIKNPTPPPPASKPPAYVLYILSVVTFFVVTYLFLIYPTCCAQRSRKAVGTPFTEGPGGMMVLPVPGGQQNGKKAKGKKGKAEGEGVQVNLIVDPGMFGDNMREDDDEDDNSDSEFTGPGSFASSERRRRKGQRARRRSVFAGLALEAQWKQARKMMKWGAFVDALMLFAWGAEFVYILIGKRCPSGAFNGWCDAYNLATAASCLICVSFGLSIFFDVKDLHASKASPRTRMQS